MSSKVEHVVVLMLENRSFDNLFGLYPGADGIAGKGLYNLRYPDQEPSPGNPRFPAGPGAPFVIEKGQGPSHSLNGTNVQLFGDRNGPRGGPTNIGFVKSYASSLRADRTGRPTERDLAIPMLCFSPADLPSLNELARQFVLCDRWFAEVPGPTMPNRLYVHTGTSAGWARNDWRRTFDLRSIYESLMEAGKSWAVYYSDECEVAKLNRVNHLREAFRLYDTRFAPDARAGRLPSYTFVIPRFAAGSAGPVTSMQPPEDLRPGDGLVADVYEALRANEAAWQKTLLVITFDEHGGFYDHVLPPEGVPNPDGISSPAPSDRAAFAPYFDFDRLGLRVPAILVSPWLPKGRVDSTLYQHTSILSTLRSLFGLSGPLTRRDASARPFDALLAELSAPRTDTPLTLPRAPLDEIASAASEPPDAVQVEMARGWAAILKSTPMPTTVLEVLERPLPEPETQGEAMSFIRDAVGRYLDARAHAAGVRPPGAVET